MTNDNQLTITIISNFATTGTSLNLINCIEQFDSGRNNIYIIDKEGKYTGLAVTKHNFKRIWKNINDIIISIPAIDYSINNQQKLQQALQIFNKYPMLNEIPLIKNNRINAVIINKFPAKPQGFRWDVFYSTLFSPDVFKYNKIYLSSLENQDIFDFYKTWNTKLPLIPLGNHNVIKAVNDKNSLIIYGEDVFPECNKISVIEFWNKLIIYAIKFIANFCYISSEYAAVNIKDVGDRVLFIQNFDKGFNAVSVIDDNEKFIDIVIPSTFREDFPKKNFRRWNNLYINYSGNDELMKMEIARWCFGSARQELPILKNGKIVASGRKGLLSSAVQNDNFKTIPVIYWNLIDTYIMKDFFGEHKKVLISSDYGDLEGFREYFNEILDITVYNDSILENYLSGEFDVLIYSADIWSNTSTIKYSARSLYVYLLNEKLRKYLLSNNISYYVIGNNNAPIVGMEHKTKYQERIIKSQMMFDGIYNDYFILSDKNYYNVWNCNNGIRYTEGNPKHYEQTIYFFGHCIASGIFTNDNETIESYLQNLINQNNIKCRTVNCGQIGMSWDIAVLYRIMNTNFNENDIVVFLDLHESSIELKNNVPNHFFLSEIFNKFELKNCKLFIDEYPGHLNAEGNKVVAEFLWTKLKDQLTEQAKPSRKRVRSMFSSYSMHGGGACRVNKMNPDLKQYLDVLEKERVDCENIGAIVMNCNPFTRGHRYLIEQALQIVDFLYVFVVEEDSSDFPFKDRFAIVKANCEDLPNIKVMPSGKYMISSITFAEYFQKDNLQDQQTMIPAMDIRLFGQAIAPTLNITKRFVGEEPLDTVTRQYNEAMQDMLPGYGVELIELPRLTLEDGEPISATKVRKLISEGNLTACQRYLTDQTYLYINENFKRIKKLMKNK